MACATDSLSLVFSTSLESKSCNLQVLFSESLVEQSLFSQPRDKRLNSWQQSADECEKTSLPKWWWWGTTACTNIIILASIKNKMAVVFLIITLYYNALNTKSMNKSPCKDTQKFEYEKRLEIFLNNCRKMLCLWIIIFLG